MQLAVGDWGSSTSLVGELEARDLSREKKHFLAQLAVVDQASSGGFVGELEAVDWHLVQLGTACLISTGS